MRPFFIATPGGQLVAFHHVVRLDVLTTGVLDQLRFEVQASLVSGERQVLGSFRGAGGHGQADVFIAELLRRGETEAFTPQLAGVAGRP